MIQQNKVRVDISGISEFTEKKKKKINNTPKESSTQIPIFLQMVYSRYLSAV